MVAVPGPSRGVRNQVSQGPGDAVLVPGAVLGEGFQGFPGGGLLQGQDRLGDGVFLDVQRHGGDPLGEAVEAAAGEGPSEGVEQGLPDGPGELSLGHDASPVLEPVGSLTTYLAGSDQETLLFNTVRLISYCGVFRGNYCLKTPAAKDLITDDHLALIHRSWRVPARDAEFDGQKMYQIHVILFGEKAALDRVEYVVYRLDPTYPDPVQCGGPRRTQFELKELAYGYFL